MLSNSIVIKHGRGIKKVDGEGVIAKDPVLSLLVYKAAAKADVGLKGKELAPIKAMPKLFATDIAMEIATDAMQLFGCSGISKDNRIEQYFRDAKVLQIIEGTNQIQRNIIGKHVVKTY